MTDENQDQVPPNQEQGKPEEFANPWITDLKEKCNIRKGHHAYVDSMLGGVPAALEEDDEWKIQGLKMGLWEEYTKIEKLDENILGLLAKIEGLDLIKEAGSAGKRRTDIHLAMMKLDQALESLKPGGTKPEEPKTGTDATAKLHKLKLLTSDG